MGKQLGTVEVGKITGLKKLSDNEYEEYKINLHILMEFSKKQHLFTILNLNYKELKNTLDKYLVEYQNNQSINWIKMEEMYVDTNRLLLNFLSTFRTYLDHTESMLKGKYGKESENTKRFLTLCSEQFDNYFSYRFLYKLRNYTQHCGMPLGSLTINSKAIDNKSKDIINYLAIFFDRDTLLKNYDSWTVIKNEIEKLPTKIEITPFVDEVMECISKINSLVIEYEFENLSKSSQYFENLILPFNEIKETIAILDVVKSDGEEPKINIEWLPFHILDVIGKIKKSYE